MAKLRVYLSGCMTVDKDHFKQHFSNVAQILEDTGKFKITNTATGEYNDEEVKKLGLDIWSAEAWIYYIKRDIDLVSKHDIICLLKGWENSMGVYAELATAKRFGLSVMFESDNFKTIITDWDIKDLKKIEENL